MIVISEWAIIPVPVGAEAKGCGEEGQGIGKTAYQGEVVKGEEIAVAIKGNSGVRDGVCYVEVLSGTRRTMKALKVLLIWVVVGLASIAIPILHFFTVPIFLLAGIIFAGYSYSVRSVVLGGSGSCPYCDRPFVIVKSREHWPLRDQCAECFRQVQIEKQRKV